MGGGDDGNGRIGGEFGLENTVARSDRHSVVLRDFIVRFSKYHRASVASSYSITSTY